MLGRASVTQPYEARPQKGNQVAAHSPTLVGALPLGVSTEMGDSVPVPVPSSPVFSDGAGLTNSPTFVSQFHPEPLEESWPTSAPLITPGCNECLCAPETSF